MDDDKKITIAATIADESTRDAIAFAVKSQFDLLFAASCSRLASSDALLGRAHKKVKTYP